MIVQCQSVGPLNAVALEQINIEWSLFGAAGPVGTIAQATLNQNATTVVGVPFGTTPNMVIVVPPTTNTQQWQIKGAGADTGVSCAPTLPALWQVGSAGLGISLGLAAGTNQVFTFIWL